MSISSLIVHAVPTAAATVARSLSAIAGVEVHAATPDGRIIVTIDQDDGQAADTMASLRDIAGVASVSLVYSHFDDIPAEKEQADEPIQA